MKRIALVLLCSLFVAALAFTSRSAPLRADAPPPTLDRPLYASTVGGMLALAGTGLGDEGQARSIQFNYDSSTVQVAETNSAVEAWSSSEIRLTLPVEVRSGTVQVIVDGVASVPASNLVYEYLSYPLPSGTGSSEFPLALDVSDDGRVWILEEAHSNLKWLSPATASSQVKTGKILVPQADGAGIFAANYSAPVRTRLSGRGEDLDIGSDGSIWFTQGGSGEMPDSPVYNSSRIVRYRPSTGQFDCYPVPTDNAETIGLLLDEANGRVWYTDTNIAAGNAIVSFQPDTIASDCNWDPYVHARPLVCSEGEPDSGCHKRYVAPGFYPSPAHLVFGPDGAIWFTRYWNTSVGRLDPISGEFLTLPLPQASVRAGPGLFVGSGPWELAFDSSGDLWISEYFDGSLLRVRPSLMTQHDCEQLDSGGENPCVEHVFVGSDGNDSKYLHSLSVGTQGRVWFSFAHSIGLMSPQHGGAVALFQPAGLPDWVTGIVEDDSGAVWFALFEEKKIGVLRPAVGDADGVDDVVDNCPHTYNPDQANADRNFVDLSPWNKPFNDMTWPASDNMGDACDDDADNDGLSNEAEANPAAYGCPSASAPLDPLVRDTDADLVLDGAECMLGSDPASPASLPVPPGPATDPDRDGLSTATELLIGTDPLRRDTDGDRIDDGAEFRSYGSDPLSRNGDGDTCGDVYEAASLNGDSAVNSIDMLILATSFGPQSSPKYVPQFDVNRDRSINSGDLGTAAVVFGPCRTN